MSESKPKKQRPKNKSYKSYKNLIDQIKNNETTETTNNKFTENFSDETELRLKGLGGGNFNKIDKI